MLRWRRCTVRQGRGEPGLALPVAVGVARARGVAVVVGLARTRRRTGVRGVGAVRTFGTHALLTMIVVLGLGALVDLSRLLLEHLDGVPTELPAQRSNGLHGR